MNFLSKIYQYLVKDDAVTLDATYSPNTTDRRFIDNQIQGIQQHLVDALIQSKHASWFRAASTLKAGDVACAAGIVPTDAFSSVTLALPSPLTAAGRVTGVVLVGSATNGFALVAVGGHVPATITGLGAVSGAVKVSTTGRCQQVSSFGSSDYGVGHVDAAGNLTVYASGVGGGSLPGFAPRRNGLSPKYVFNILNYGGVPDADVNFGLLAGSGATQLATDNAPALEAAVAAIQASGAPGEVYFPFGIYYFSRQVIIAGTYPVTISGDVGHQFAFGGGHPTQLVWPNNNALDSNRATKDACLLFNTAAGSAIRDLTIWACPNSQAWRHWTPGLHYDYNIFVIPSTGGIGFVFHPTFGAPGLTGSTNEPIWGVKFDNSRRYEVGQFFWSEITDPLNSANTVWQYTFSAATGDQRTADDQNPYNPYAGFCKIAGNGVQFTSADVGTSVRPADGVWGAANGSLYTVVSVAATVNLTADPNWAAAATGSLSVSQNGVVFQRAQPCLPRTVGLTTLIPNATGGSLSVTLTSTSGLLHDLNNTGGGTGALDWEVRAPVHGIRTQSSTHITNVSIQTALGDAIFIGAGVGHPGDAWIVRDCFLSHSARNGITIQGGDANIGIFNNNQILGHGDTGIADNSFLGCSFYGGQLADEQNGHPGNFSIRVYQTTNASVFGNVYIEGAYAPAWLRGGQIYGRNGLWSFYPDSGFVGAQGVDDSNARHTPRQFTAGPKGIPWVITRSNQSRKTYLNDFVLPFNGSSLRMQVTAVSYAGARKAQSFVGVATNEPTWPTVASGTVTETSTTTATASSMTGTGVPIVVTTATPHPFDTGDQVTGSGVVGNTNANVTCKVISLSPVTFQLITTSGAIINGNANWVSGGTFTRTDTITYTALSTATCGITIGSDADPPQAYNVIWSDCPGGPGNLTSFGLRAHTPVTNEIGWTFGNNPGNCPIACGYVGGVPYARFLYQVRVNDEVLGTGGADATSGTNTTNPDDSCKRWSGTVTSATSVVVNNYTPPDGSVVDIVWNFVVKQTAGTGNPKGAKFRVSYSVRRAGSVLTVLDAATVIAGSANELTPTVAVDITSAPLIKLTFNSADATKTFVLGGIREVLGLPTA